MPYCWYSYGEVHLCASILFNADKQRRPKAKWSMIAKMLDITTCVSDHINQDIFLTFQTGGCLLLHESSAECRAFCTTSIQQ